MKIPTAQKPPIDRFVAWFSESRNQPTKKYLHVLLDGSSEIPKSALEQLRAFIAHSHEGAKNCLRAPLGFSLSPLKRGTRVDPAFGYPHKLNMTCQKGFLGEILTGIAAENFAPLPGNKWEVPVFLFRVHTIAFQQLEEMRQTNNWKKQVFGRTGDDGLAFQRDTHGNIICWLASESKCTGEHSSTLIDENHKKLNDSTVKTPIDLLRVIDALGDYADDKYARDWIRALRKLFFSKNAQRYDLSLYACGQKPQRSLTWIPTTAPHNSYTIRRPLTCVEIHLSDIENLISKTYRYQIKSK